MKRLNKKVTAAKSNIKELKKLIKQLLQLLLALLNEEEDDNNNNDEDYEIIFENSNKLQDIFRSLNTGDVDTIIQQVRNIAEKIINETDIDLKDSTEITEIVNEIEEVTDTNNLTEEEQFIQECEDSGKFNEDQMYQIRLGFKKGLTMEEVKLYADSKFRYGQMQEIYWGFEDSDLTIEQVKLYAKPEFKANQMHEIRSGFHNGLSIEQVKLYATTEFDCNQMWKIKKDLMHGMSIDEVKEKYNL